MVGEGVLLGCMGASALLACESRVGVAAMQSNVGCQGAGAVHSVRQPPT